MKLTFLLITFFICSLAAAQKKKHEHRSHDTHVHGAGDLALAFDATQGKIEFNIAAESILGFEHKPKNKKDEKAVADAKAYFENEMSKLIQMDSALGCQFTKEMIGQISNDGNAGSGHHSSWVANFKISCAKSPIGTKIVIDFSHFKLLKKVNISILADSIQKSSEFKGKPVFIELK